MTMPSSTLTTLQRLSSGVPGLDQVLGGGFFQAGVYIVHGLPGSGKTILANQLCYHQAEQGGRAVYVTLLAESHSRMLQHIHTLSFFDETAIPERVSYLSAFNVLEADGLKGLMTVLRQEMRSLAANVLVLDGLVAAAEAAPTDRDLKKFIHELQTSAVFHGCTVFLLTSGTPQRISAEHTMVDGILELEERLYEARSERAIQVRKFRGAASLRGKHPLRITDAGLQVFPRIESMFAKPPEPQEEPGVLSTGIATLDAMIEGGGLPGCSASVVVGSTGTGKTTMGLHFLSRSSTEEPGLLFGFFESPGRLRAKGRKMGLNIDALEASGALHLMWTSQGEHVLDEMGHRLLDAVQRLNIKRVVIDGLSGFFESAVHPERITRYFSCLANELRRRGATVLMTLETRDVVGSLVSLPYGVSGFVDNLFFLRFVEDQGHVKRLLTVTKMRDTQFELGLHAFHIGNQGMLIAGLHTANGDVIPSASVASGSPPPDA
ncbi:ATPase domain-containing protein [Aquabacterium sp.]|uniref:ATPase domain-containing protein n=1 Tax=Aquabacterium sp. TaxID=1872578 RepID=UPI003D6CA2CD